MTTWTAKRFVWYTARLW